MLPTESREPEVSRLVLQLGDDDYYRRRSAEQQLISRGSDVFDRLQQAQEHPDLEIALRANYILQKLRIDWVRPDDPEEVRLLLQNYEDLSSEKRRKCIDALVRLEKQRGLGPLCRIVRFEPTLLLARYAAVRILQFEAEHKLDDSIEAMRSELGIGERAPVEWVFALLNAPDDESSAHGNWLRLIDQEIALLTEDSPDTDAAMVLSLIDTHLQRSRDTDDTQRLFELLRRRTDVALQGSGGVRSGLFKSFHWIWKHERWDVIDLLERHYADAIRGDRVLMYYSALSHWKQGQVDLSESLAQRAFDLEGDDMSQRDGIGNLIGELGRHDWAEREWQLVVESVPVLESAESRRWLASLRYHDRGEHQKAAQMMIDVCQAIEKDGRLKSQLSRSSLLKQYFAQRDYFLAAQAAADGDYLLQRKLLESAYRYDNLDADVIIAMYRSKEADEEYRKKVVDRVQKAAQKLQQEIKDDPTSSVHYNHYAWLVSNTEGDLQKAVECSKKSLEINPDSPSYLDTLGRCYFAVGEIDKAIEVQRKAVERHPYLQVMQDQLELFEAKLAEQQQ